MTNCYLSKLRSSKGYTQESLAEELGVSQSTIASYERGIRRPSPAVFKRLMEMFQLTLEEAWEMFYGDGEGDGND